MYVDFASVCSCQQCSYASSTSDCDGPCHKGERRPAANDSAQTTASDWCYRCYWSGTLIFCIVDGLFLQLKASTLSRSYSVSSRFMTNFRFCMMLDLSVLHRFCFPSHLLDRPEVHYNLRERPHNKVLILKTVDLNDRDFLVYDVYKRIY